MRKLTFIVKLVFYSTKYINFLLYVISVDVLVTLTQDLGKIMAAMQSVKLSGDSDFVSALQIAQVHYEIIFK